MKEIKKYLAFDGTVWDSEEECAYHEKLDVEEMYEWAMKIKAYCKNMKNCADCLFDKDIDYNGNCSIGIAFLPEDWAVDEFESEE